MQFEFDIILQHHSNKWQQFLFSSLSASVAHTATVISRAPNSLASLNHRIESSGFEFRFSCYFVTDNANWNTYYLQAVVYKSCIEIRSFICLDYWDCFVHRYSLGWTVLINYSAGDLVRIHIRIYSLLHLVQSTFACYCGRCGHCCYCYIIVAIVFVFVVVIFARLNYGELIQFSENSKIKCSSRLFRICSYFWHYKKTPIIHPVPLVNATMLLFYIFRFNKPLKTGSKLVTR